MLLSQKLKILLNEHIEFNNRALDWLILSWEHKTWKKMRDLECYRKYKEKAHKITLRILEISNEK